MLRNLKEDIEHETDNNKDKMQQIKILKREFQKIADKLAEFEKNNIDSQGKTNDEIYNRRHTLEQL